MIDPKTVIVTGSNGQDGSYMVDYLIENTNNLIVAATRRTSQPILKHLEKYKDEKRVKFITLDLDDQHSIDKAVREEKPDYFINFGASAFVPDSWNMPEYVLKVNALSVVHILESIRKNKPECRFYNASSSEIFGDVKESPQNENTPPSPRSVYGVSKNTAREITKVYRESYGLYAVSGILFNHESPRRQDHYVTQKIIKGALRIKKEHDEGKLHFKPLELGNVGARRDWSHSKDVIHGIWLMLNQAKPKDYVLSSGETHTVAEFVEKAFQKVGINGFWDHSEFNERSKFLSFNHHFPIRGPLVLVKINPEFYRPAEVDLLLGDCSLAKKELGWRPEFSFDDLIAEMILKG